MKILMKLAYVFAASSFGTAAIAADNIVIRIGPFNADMPIWELAIAVLILLVVILAPLLFLGHLLMTRRPDYANSRISPRIEIFFLPGWELRRVHADAFLALSSEDGWLGHGIAKYIKDKGDYGLDDVVRANAPIASGTAKIFPVRRLPTRFLIVTNIYDELKLTGQAEFDRGIASALRLAAANGCHSVVIFDPAEQWNYFTHRTDASEAALMLIHALRNSGKKIEIARIIVTAKEGLEAYKGALERLTARTRPVSEAPAM